MSDEKRKAGRYEIIQALYIGDREIVIGEDIKASTGQMYMCSFCKRDAVFANYYDLLVSDNYPEIVEIFGKRVAEQANRTRLVMDKPQQKGITDITITLRDCQKITHDDDLNNKIIVIDPNVLRREYRIATSQIKLCVGGFGASPHSRGSACYCVNLYSGEISRYERRDVLGILDERELPEWAKKGLADYRNNLRKEAEKRKKGQER